MASRIGAQPLHVLASLARRADADGRCWPSVATIAADCALSESSVHRALRSLVAEGALLIIRRTGHANVFQIVAGCGGVTDGTPTGVSPGTSGVPGQAPRGVSPGTQNKTQRTRPKEQDKGASPKRRPIEVSDVQMPAILDTAECRSSLQEWLEHKRSKGKGYKSTAAIEKKLAEYDRSGPAAFIAAVNHSIGNNYDGLFPPGGRNGKQLTLAGPGQRFDPNGRLGDF